MHVLWQDHPCVNFERVPLLDGANYFSKRFDMTNKKVVPFSFKEIDGEKISAAWVPGASVVRHWASMVVRFIRRNALRLESAPRVERVYWALTPYLLNLFRGWLWLWR